MARRIPRSQPSDPQLLQLPFRNSYGSPAAPRADGLRRAFLYIDPADSGAGTDSPALREKVGAIAVKQS